jgi:hypothetical protein
MGTNGDRFIFWHVVDLLTLAATDELLGEKLGSENFFCSGWPNALRTCGVRFTE